MKIGRQAPLSPLLRPPIHCCCPPLPPGAVPLPPSPPCCGHQTHRESAEVTTIESSGMTMRLVMRLPEAPAEECRSFTSSWARYSSRSPAIPPEATAVATADKDEEEEEGASGVKPPVEPPPLAAGIAVSDGRESVPPGGGGYRDDDEAGPVRARALHL